MGTGAGLAKVFAINPQIMMFPGAAVTALWRPYPVVQLGEPSPAPHLDLFVTDPYGYVWSSWWEAGSGWHLVCGSRYDPDVSRCYSERGMAPGWQPP